MPSGEASGLTLAVTDVELAGIFHRIQCVTSITPFCGAASVSCITNTKLVAPDGGLLQDKAGEAAFGSAHEIFVGICPPSLNAELISLNLEGGGACCCCAAALPTPARTKSPATPRERINLFILFPPQSPYRRF